MSEPQPAGLGAEAHHRLSHRQADEFGVAEPGRSASAPGSSDLIVDLNVGRGQEGVQLGRHKLILGTLVVSASGDTSGRLRKQVPFAAGAGTLMALGG